MAEMPLIGRVGSVRTGGEDIEKVETALTMSINWVVRVEGHLEELKGSRDPQYSPRSPQRF